MEQCPKCCGAGEVLGKDLGGDYANFPTSHYSCDGCNGFGQRLTPAGQDLLEIVCPKCQGSKEMVYPNDLIMKKKFPCNRCRQPGGWDRHGPSTGKIMSPLAEALLDLVTQRLKVGVLNEDCEISRK